jgi:hypothetical protein
MKTITPQIRRAAPVPPPPATATRASVELQIDAVVLHGFSRSDGHRAAAALQRELTRLVTAHGLPEFSSATSAHLDAGTIPAMAARPELTGIRAARAIHGGLRT